MGAARPWGRGGLAFFWRWEQESGGRPRPPGSPSSPAPSGGTPLPTGSSSPAVFCSPPGPHCNPGTAWTPGLVQEIVLGGGGAACSWGWLTSRHPWASHLGLHPQD